MCLNPAYNRGLLGSYFVGKMDDSRSDDPSVDPAPCSAVGVAAGDGILT
jgi:hypothetical protein